MPRRFGSCSAPSVSDGSSVFMPHGNPPPFTSCIRHQRRLQRERRLQYIFLTLSTRTLKFWRKISPRASDIVVMTDIFYTRYPVYPGYAQARQGWASHNLSLIKSLVPDYYNIFFIDQILELCGLNGWYHIPNWHWSFQYNNRKLFINLKKSIMVITYCYKYYYYY